jgi:hypothetical protein
VKSLLNDFNKYIDKSKGKKGNKENPEEVLENILAKLRKLFLIEEKGQKLITMYGLTAQKKTLDDLNVRVNRETSRLVANYQVPREVSKKVREEAIENDKEIKKLINKQAIIGREVKNQSASMTLQTKGALRSIRMVARAEKKSSYKAQKALNDIEDLFKQLRKDESLHNLDKIKYDLVQIEKGDEKIIKFIHSDIIFCLLFMQRIGEDIKKLKDAIKKIGTPRKLDAIHKKIEQEWKYFMNDIDRVLQQLRFSVAPAEIKQAA